MNTDPWPELRWLINRAKARIRAYASRLEDEHSQKILDYVQYQNRVQFQEYTRRRQFKSAYPDLRDPVEAEALDTDYAMRRRTAKALVIEIWAWKLWREMKRKREDALVNRAASTQLLRHQAD